MISAASSRSPGPIQPRAPGGWLLLALLAVSTPARADIPPPPGYVETCTVERQCQHGKVDICYASHRERDTCARRHVNDGFEFKCRTRGATVWTELWCRPAASKPAVLVPASAAKSP